MNTTAPITLTFLSQFERFIMKLLLDTEKYFRNLMKSTRNQIVFTIFRLIWNKTDVRLDPNYLCAYTVQMNTTAPIALTFESI